MRDLIETNQPFTHQAIRRDCLLQTESRFDLFLDVDGGA